MVYRTMMTVRRVRGLGCKALYRGALASAIRVNAHGCRKRAFFRYAARPDSIPAPRSKESGPSRHSTVCVIAKDSLTKRSRKPEIWSIQQYFGAMERATNCCICAVQEATQFWRNGVSRPVFLSPASHIGWHARFPLALEDSCRYAANHSLSFYGRFEAGLSCEVYPKGSRVDLENGCDGRGAGCLGHWWAESLRADVRWEGAIDGCCLRSMHSSNPVRRHCGVGLIRRGEKPIGEPVG